jgi:hypothetical protein
MSKQIFDDLRTLAAESRDRKLAEIRAEYSQAIADIAEMEQRLIGKPIAIRPKDKREEKLVDIVAAVIPHDRIVTVDDIQGLITANDPERRPNIQTVRATLHRLVKEGTIKKVNHPQADRKVGYCLPDFDAEAVRPLIEWAEEVLRESGQPMTPVEIMVRMTERGYMMECEPQKSVRNLERAMQSADYFIEKNGQYAC